MSGRRRGRVFTESMEEVRVERFNPDTEKNEIIYNSVSMLLDNATRTDGNELGAIIIINNEYFANISPPLDIQIGDIFYRLDVQDQKLKVSNSVIKRGLQQVHLTDENKLA